MMVGHVAVCIMHCVIRLERALWQRGRVREDAVLYVSLTFQLISEIENWFQEKRKMRGQEKTVKAGRLGWQQGKLLASR